MSCNSNKRFIKDPDAILDYQVDWSSWLFSDTIASSTWIVHSGLTSANPSFDDTTTTVWISGGTDGERYEVINRIVTYGGRTDDRTLIISVEER